jgi:hypothetical protein
VRVLSSAKHRPGGVVGMNALSRKDEPTLQPSDATNARSGFLQFRSNIGCRSLLREMPSASDSSSYLRCSSPAPGTGNAQYAEPASKKR